MQLITATNYQINYLPTIQKAADYYRNKYGSFKTPYRNHKFAKDILQKYKTSKNDNDYYIDTKNYYRLIDIECNIAINTFALIKSYLDHTILYPEASYTKPYFIIPNLESSNKYVYTFYARLYSISDKEFIPIKKMFYDKAFRICCYESFEIKFDEYSDPFELYNLCQQKILEFNQNYGLNLLQYSDGHFILNDK